MILLRHIQLIFSSHVKTFKTGKCFVRRNNFSVKFEDKLAYLYLGFDASKLPFTREFYEYSGVARLAAVGFFRVQGNAAFPNSRFSAVMQCVLLSSLVLVRRWLP